MNKINKASSADHADTHKQLMFLSMFLLSLVYAGKTVLYFVEAPVDNYLSITTKILVGLMFVAILATIYWKIKFIPGAKRYLLASEDSYVSKAMNQASKISWMLTFVLLAITTTIVNNESSAFPAQLYIDMTLFFMAASFSISFFILFRDSGEENQLEAIQ